MNNALSHLTLRLLLLLFLVGACAGTTPNAPVSPAHSETATSDITTQVPTPPPSDVIVAGSVTPPRETTPAEPLPTMPPDDIGIPTDVSEVPIAPTHAISEGHTTLLLATFDEQPDDWERVNITIVPDEQGRWVSENGLLAQQGLEGPAGSASHIQTMLLAPTTLPDQATISAFVYPEDNPVAGLVFRATDDGVYIFRVSRQNGRKLQYYQYETETYQTLQEDEGRGFDINRWQELRVVMDEEGIHCFFDGEHVFTWDDDLAHTGGLAGVYTLATGFIFFDNLLITTPEIYHPSSP